MQAVADIALPNAPDEFDRFFQSSRTFVVGTLVMLTRSPLAAEDAAQEAYFRAYRRWEKVRELEKPEMWVLRVASNCAISAWRKRRDASDLADDLPAPQREVVDRWWLEWGLAQLTVPQRAAVILHHLEDEPVDRIAGRLGMSPSAVKTHLHRARARLRRVLQGGIEL